MTPLSQIPEAPGALPLLGHGMMIARRPLAFISSLPAHGDLVRIKLGPRPAYVTTTPELTHRVLVTNARDFERGWLFEKASRFLGSGLGTSSGNAHRRQRRMVQPSFHRDRLPAYSAVMRDQARATALRWRPGQVVDMNHAMDELSMSIATRALFSPALGTHVGDVMRRVLPVLTNGVIRRTSLPDWWAAVPTPGNRRFERAVAELRTAIGTSIAAYRRSGTDHGDLMSMLLASRDDTGAGLTDDEVYDQVVTLISAAVETVGAALAWAFYEIAARPPVQRRLHGELDQVLSGRPPGYDQLPRLVYTRRIVNEALRFSAAWLFMRRSIRQVRLGDVDLPAGTEIIYSPHLLHHDPRWFRDPHRFDPDRWAPDGTALKFPRAFVPYAAGPHQCMGNTFAQLEMVTAVAVICGRWVLRVPPGVRARAVARIDVHPDRAPVIVEHRSTDHP
ncbi:cytochrome P450 [Streptomyces poonensis]|uniref:Cytochrome P450 n=1 Tax=Streptomyces poonensis TaxID=68255 RepID=A0A918UGA7_9ACTN|nr:cytochrome P450 [Streptomyces poonensis]GGZ03903.1 cytochrome P450 [Streptomyces poonensis]GLJ90790.1 cytochrome P450 [Streptomyces poonensis]